MWSDNVNNVNAHTAHRDVTAGLCRPAVIEMSEAFAVGKSMKRIQGYLLVTWMLQDEM